MVVHYLPSTFCVICNVPIEIGRVRYVDEGGHPVHEPCYVKQITMTKPASGWRRKTRDALIHSARFVMAFSISPFIRPTTEYTVLSRTTRRVNFRELRSLLSLYSAGLKVSVFLLRGILGHTGVGRSYLGGSFRRNMRGRQDRLDNLVTGTWKTK
jgi:hypothetical protein